MNKMLVGFGDSWTFGSELDRPASQCWLYQLSNLVGCPSINKGTPASSIGHLSIQLFDFIKNNTYNDYHKIFMVGLTGSTRYLSYSNRLEEFVNITPEANYRTGDLHHSGKPPDTVQDFNIISSETYRRVQHTQWDTFLAAQTIFQFQQYCTNQNITCYFFSYFDQFDFSSYTDVIDTTVIHPTTITRSITGMDYTNKDVMKHPCFEGKISHPNIYGHEQIAKLLYTKI